MEPIKCPWNSDVDLPLIEDQELDSFRDNRTVWEIPAGQGASIQVPAMEGMQYQVRLEPAGDEVDKRMCITTEKGQYENGVPYVPPNMINKSDRKGGATAFFEDQEEERKAQPYELAVTGPFWVHVWAEKEEDQFIFKLFVDAKPV